MTPIIETERLYLYHFKLQDTNFIIELLNTDGWLKNIGDRNIRTTEEAKEYLVNGPIKSYIENGFGLSKVVLKNSLQPIGMCGLIKREGKKDIDLGFALMPLYEKQGYAYEIAQAVIAYGKKDLKLNKIVAITLPENKSSINLLEKLNFNFEVNFIENNETLSLYHLHLNK